MLKRLPGFILSICLSQAVLGQSVGLVLSGGGAKGLAHVGVIKALEENDIPIDFLAGTSMGGIIAGCYASGFSAKEIEGIVLSNDFKRWVNGELERGYNYEFSKEPPDPSFFSLKLSLDSTFNASFNSSISSDLSMNFALAETFALAAAAAKYNFDSLLVPLRIVAADIFTQKEIDIDSGSLALAIRSTLSVPFFYKPIRMDGKYLFDGGIYNNFPIDVMKREFDPSIIIGCNVSSKIFEEYPYDQDDKLINTSLLYMMLDKSNPEQIPQNGIYIEPNLTGMTALDFSKVRALIDSGYVQTMRQMPEIKAQIASRTSADEREASRLEFFAQYPDFNFSSVEVHDYNRKQRKYITRVIHKRNSPSSGIESIKKGYFRLVSEDYFRTVYPDIIYKEETQQFELNIYGRPQNNFSINIGGAIATRNISHIFVGIEHYLFNAYLLKNTLNFQTGSFYKSALARTRITLSAFNQVYLAPEFIYNNWDYLSADDIFMVREPPTILTSTDRKYGLNVGFEVGSKFKGVIHTNYIYNRDRFSRSLAYTSTDTLDNQLLKGLKTGFSLERNNLNRKYYADEGSALTVAVNYYSITENLEPGSTEGLNRVNKHHQWFKGSVRLEQYVKRGINSTGLTIDAVVSNQPLLSTYMGTIANAPTLYLFQDSPTLLLENYRANQFIAGGLKNIIRIFPNVSFRLEGYAFKALREIQRNEDNLPVEVLTPKIRLAASSSLTLHTPVGPINLSLNYYDDKENQFGILLHGGFLLYNPKSLK